MTTRRKKKPPLVSIIMGSDSDYPTMRDAVKVMKAFDVPHEKQIISAHRTPKEMANFASKAAGRGVRVIIAGAGGAAHLPGMVASYTELPVIGVPVATKALKGHDSLLSIVQMPKGVPVATVGIGNSFNAGLLAVKILSAGGEKPDLKLRKKISQYKQSLRKQVLAKKLK